MLAINKKIEFGYRHKLSVVIDRIITTIGVLIIMAVATGFVQPIGVRYCSMSPTYQDGDILFGIHRFGSFPNIDRGDVVTLYADSDNLYLKRVIGLPGDVLVSGLRPCPQGRCFASGTTEATHTTAAILARFQFLRFFRL